MHSDNYNQRNVCIAASLQTNIKPMRWGYVKNLFKW